MVKHYWLDHVHIDRVRQAKPAVRVGIIISLLKQSIGHIEICVVSRRDCLSFICGVF